MWWTVNAEWTKGTMHGECIVQGECAWAVHGHCTVSGFVLSKQQQRSTVDQILLRAFGAVSTGKQRAPWCPMWPCACSQQTPHQKPSRTWLPLHNCCLPLVRSPSNPALLLPPEMWLSPVMPAPLFLASYTALLFVKNTSVLDLLHSMRQSSQCLSRCTSSSMIFKSTADEQAPKEGLARQMYLAKDFGFACS